MRTTDLPVIGRRYQLTGKLGAGGMGIVYRALDRLHGDTIALKTVTTSPEELLFASRSDNTNFRLALSAEFRTLAGLRHPNIISVLDYGFDEAQRPYFTMEYLDNAQPVVDAASNCSFEEKLNFVIQILQALIYLHRRGILHRDLKPANALVNQGIVKVVDFGLSVVTNTDSVKHMTQTTAGTFAYMAPELFQDAPVTRASDIYALGIIMYELFAGRHPFATANVGRLIAEILTKDIDVSQTDLQPELADVLSRMLLKDSEQRYQNAKTLLIDLCNAAGIQPPAESITLRESYLQAAKFVGRNTDIDQMAAALWQAVDGLGSIWLVGGESGVGKSRFVDELRTLGLVRGVLVLRGQAVSEGSSMYDVWRDILRWICLITELDDNEASVLKPLVPDIENLVGRPVANAPELDPLLTQNRLLSVISNIFQRQQQPLMVIMEDLQWIRSESLVILTRLQQTIRQIPVFIVGTYRDDEHPNLPDEITGATVLRLQRLQTADIRELSSSILGEAGLNPQLVALLERETEGNSFFVVEVMRELAEEAGQLDQIAQMTLPQHILTGGVRQVILRRLNRVLSEHRSLLEVAAIIGREIKLDILRQFVSSTELDSWVASCVNAAVLDFQQETWRFAHDKLREMTLDELDEERRSALHRQVADAYENLYGDNVEYAATLGYHFDKGGSPEKAVHHLIRAAEYARRRYSNDEAIAAYRTAHALVQQIQTSSPAQSWHLVLMQIHEGLGDVLELIAQHEAARMNYDAAITEWLPEDGIVIKSRLYRKVAKTWEVQRNYEKAMEIYADALAQLEANQTNVSEAWWQEWIENQLDQLRGYYWLNRIAEGRLLVTQIQSSVEQYGTPLQKGLFFQSSALSEIRAERFAPSEQTFNLIQRAVEAIRNLDYSASTAWIQFGFGFILLWAEAFDDAERELKIAVGQCEQIGDATTLSRCLNYLALLYRMRGEIDKAREYCERTLQVSQSINMVEYNAMIGGILAWIAIRENRIADADKIIVPALKQFKGTPQFTMIPWVVVWPLVAVLLEKDELEEAVQYLKAMLAPSARPQPGGIQELLHRVVEEWKNGNIEQVQQHLNQAITIARQLNYI